MFQMKEQNKIPGKIPNDMEVSNLLIKKFQVTVIKMLISEEVSNGTV